MIARAWRRRHHVITRMQVDMGGWRHPRPPADPRLVLLSLGLAYVSFVQVFVYRAPETVAAQAYTSPVALAVAGLVVFSAALQLRAAFCRSQYSSWGWEIAACVGFAGQSAIQFWALTAVNDAWWAATTIAWTAFWGLGNLWRAWILLRRLW